MTLGALVLAAREEATAFSQLSSEAFTELAHVCKDTETVLKKQFDYDKMNYLMLMMVDPDVHFHVIPRYAEQKTHLQVEFNDFGWPGPPDLGHSNDVSDEFLQNLTAELQAEWPH